MSPLTIKQGEQYVTVPCGKCYSCLSNRRNDWTYRLKIEVKHAVCSFFLTLTVSDEKDRHYGNVSKKDVQDFLKRFRKTLPSNSVRYYLISEYTPTGTHRPHYHILLFLSCLIDRERLEKKVLDTWDYGFIRLDNINAARIHYVTSYHITKGITPPGMEPVFALMSRKPGIGYQYIKENANRHKGTNTTVVSDGGLRQRMPRYYCDKLYTKKAKEMIGIHNRRLSMKKMEDQVNRLMALNNWSEMRAVSYIRWQNYNQKSKIAKILKTKSL